MRKLILYTLLICSQSLFAFGKTRLGELYYLLDDYTLTAEVTASIDQHGMAGNYPDLVSVIIPDTISYMGTKYAVKSIGEQAFANSANLTTVVVPDHIQSIGDDAFADCRNLTSVMLPKGIDYLFRTFSTCTSMRRITLPQSLTKANALFYRCVALDSVYMPPKITLLASTFAECRSLQQVTLPDSLQIIRRLTFDNCQSLHTITIPAKVTEVNTQAFKDCPALDTIRVLAVTPPAASAESFSGMNKSSCVLLVPAQSGDLYRKADGWKDFNVQPLNAPTDINNISTPVENKAVKILQNGQISIIHTTENGTHTYTITGQER